mmetsp:Transcript_3338/g.4876  ORF Transcript_3338/g.4876 Transcript_3338/m.4876 type:complete len:414 (+) Transcript_3338:75-1316(+)
MSQDNLRSKRIPLDIPSQGTTAPSLNGDWSSVFQSAASVKLVELDSDFLTRTASTKQDEGLAKISQLAKIKQQHHHHHKRKRNEEEEPPPNKLSKSEGNEISSPDVSSPNEPKQSQEEETLDQDASLEGKMVPHPNKSGQQLMVLINRTRNTVYSALKRTDSGNLIEIGKLFQQDNAKHDSITWDDQAFHEEDDIHEQGCPDFPFPTDPDDHCESPLEAYSDIMPFLENLGKDCRIYDPYYCNGAVKEHLLNLGFQNVYNVKEDCYKVWANKETCPRFDLFLTNPPYSDDHIPKLAQYLLSLGDKPWALLMPQWVHKKEYWHKTWNHKCFYLVPRKRYTYKPPKDFRAAKASDVHKKSSPFVSMWYLWGGTLQKTQEWAKIFKSVQNKRCHLVRSKNALRDLRRKGNKKQDKK